MIFISTCLIFWLKYLEILFPEVDEAFELSISLYFKISVIDGSGKGFTTEFYRGFPSGYNFEKIELKFEWTLPLLILYSSLFKLNLLQNKGFWTWCDGAYRFLTWITYSWFTDFRLSSFTFLIWSGDKLEFDFSLKLSFLIKAADLRLSYRIMLWYHWGLMVKLVFPFDKLFYNNL